MRGVILQTDEQALQRHLDAQPGDMVTRLVLADLLEEQGRDDEAKAQRLLVEMKLWPDNHLYLTFERFPGYRWWSRATGEHNSRIYSAIPAKFQPYMPDGLWLYETRLEAEAVFLQALRDAGEL